MREWHVFARFRLSNMYSRTSSSTHVFTHSFFNTCIHALALQHMYSRTSSSTHVFTRFFLQACLLRSLFSAPYMLEASFSRQASPNLVLQGCVLRFCSLEMHMHLQHALQHALQHTLQHASRARAKARSHQAGEVISEPSTRVTTRAAALKTRCNTATLRHRNTATRAAALKTRHTA